MNLTQELANYQSQFQTKVPAQLQSVMKRATKDLADSHIIDRTLKVGDRIPVFSLPDALGQNFEIKTALQQGYAVISFYRGGWCPYCNLELKALQQILPDIEAAGAKLIAISPETPDSSLSTKEKNELDFVVLSDQGNKVAQEFGLVFELPMELRPIYRGFGIDIESHNGDKSFKLPVPATYVVAPSGEIVYAFADADYTKRAEPDEVIAALKQTA